MDAAIAAADVTCRGDEWGEPPLWTVENKEAGFSVDVHAVDEAEARAKALASVRSIAPAAPLEKLIADLEKLPPDRPVTASDLLASLAPPDAAPPA